MEAMGQDDSPVALPPGKEPLARTKARWALEQVSTWWKKEI
jgi:hypothetical protein